jgi:alkanesulfonate monooxygenase SsuD/methylene tetrahydromethanopterin reductase-like flavin-dependent oxidoreductase (luciferase family)
VWSPVHGSCAAHQEDLDSLETWTAAAVLAALISRIEIIVAIRSSLFQHREAA